MIEPYRTMFAGYEDHWLFAEYLTSDQPNWYGLAHDPRIEALSTGEKVLADFAAAYRNILIYLDDDHLARVRSALRLVL